MVSETSDLHFFLADHPLFGQLSPDQLDYASNNILVGFAKAGSQILVGQDRSQAPGLLIIRSGSLEVRTGTQQLLDRLSTGDYLVPDLFFSNPQRPKVLVLEDCLFYELNQVTFQLLVSKNPQLNSLIKSKNNIAALDGASSATSFQFAIPTQLDAYVKDFMSTTLVSGHPGMSIYEAAQKMHESNVSSLLITDQDSLVGILTDRDLRSRVLATGLSSAELVSRVMTASPKVIDRHAHLHQAQIKMMSAGIHHLPVVENNNLIGMISLSDVIRAHNIEPLSLNKGIRSAKTLEELSSISTNIPDLIVKLIERDTRAEELGHIITSLTDAITCQLLRIAEQKFGNPPCEYAWIAFGSQARQEQMLGSDQDNGLVLSDEVQSNDIDYFKDFAEYVNNGLDQCGMPLCPGNIMAKNEQWRMSLRNWRLCFKNWIDDCSPEALLNASIFFDMRFIYGQEHLIKTLYEEVLNLAKRNTIFLAHMCGNALLHSPPLGFFKTFVLESDGDHDPSLDLKKRGTIPIVDLARNYALASGVEAVNTLDRLKSFATLGTMSASMAHNLRDAHEFIAGIRLKAQGKEFRVGQKIDNFLDPKELSPLVRHQLKDAFSIVREAQQSMKVSLSGGLI